MKIYQKKSRLFFKIEWKKKIGLKKGNKKKVNALFRKFYKFYFVRYNFP